MRKSKRRKYEKFGAYLKWLRKNNTQFEQTQAAEQLGLSKQQLNQFESGQRMPHHHLLIRLAHLYHVPTAEVLENAYWPQLVLIPLIAIVDPEQISKDLIRELERGLKEKERTEITQHIEKLLIERETVKPH